MTCQIVGCDKTATVYATENTETVPMCSDCYGYLNTRGDVEYVGVIRDPQPRKPDPIITDSRPNYVEHDCDTCTRASRAAGPVLWRQIRRAIGV